MATHSTPLWQPDRPWVSTGRILLLVALWPVFLVGFLLAAVASVIDFVFPRRPSSARDMADALTELLAAGSDNWDLDDAIQNVVGRKYSDPRIETLKLRVKQFPELPWTQETIDELVAMRESAAAIAEEGQT